MNIADAIEECCQNPLDSMTWGEWRDAFKEIGIKILDDDSGFQITKVLSSTEARAAISRCTTSLQVDQEVATVEVFKHEDSTLEWAAKYTQLCQTPPGENEILQTEDGSQVRLEIELFPNRPPLIYTRVYVPNIVCGKLGWFAQSINNDSQFGWKMILLRKSRDDTIKRFGLNNKVLGVKAIRVNRPSASQKSLLGEVAEW